MSCHLPSASVQAASDDKGLDDDKKQLCAAKNLLVVSWIVRISSWIKNHDNRIIPLLNSSSKNATLQAKLLLLMGWVKKINIFNLVLIANYDSRR